MGGDNEVYYKLFKYDSNISIFVLREIKLFLNLKKTETQNKLCEFLNNEPLHIQFFNLKKFISCIDNEKI